MKEQRWRRSCKIEFEHGTASYSSWFFRLIGKTKRNETEKRGHIWGFGHRWTFFRNPGRLEMSEAEKLNPFVNDDPDTLIAFGAFGVNLHELSLERKQHKLWLGLQPKFIREPTNNKLCCHLVNERRFELNFLEWISLATWWCSRGDGENTKYFNEILLDKSSGRARSKWTFKFIHKIQKKSSSRKLKLGSAENEDARKGFFRKESG